MLAHSEFTTADKRRLLSSRPLFLAVFLFLAASFADTSVANSQQADSQSVNDLKGRATARAAGPHATATLRLPEVFLASSEGASQAFGSEIAIEFVLKPEWHIYWLNPGDSGEEPRFEFAKSDFLEFGAAIFPTPFRIPAGPFTNFGFDSGGNPVTIRFPVRVRAGFETKDQTADKLADVVVKLTYLVCKEECVPAEAVLAASAPIRFSDKFAKTTIEYDSRKYPTQTGLGSRELPIQSTWRWLPGSEPNSIALKVLDPNGKEFFPLVSAVTSASFVAGDGGRPQKGDQSNKQDSELIVAIDPATVTGEFNSDAPIVGLLVDKKTRESSWVSFEKESRFDWLGLLKTLGLAFLGGILLNLMPCVFPVVSLKVMSFVNESRGDSRETKLHALLYAAGVLISLWFLVAVLLGLRSAGAAIGWGFQLQSSVFLFGLYAVFLFLGFNLLGLFEINYAGPSFFQNALAARGRAGSFFTGLLTTVVATPCSAPFMGVAIGAALAAGPLESVLVFTSLGTGLALPYVILGFSPRMVAFLPRPGLWMERLKQGLAFPLFMTAVWLMWVLSQSTESAALIVILVWTVFAGFLIWALHSRLRWLTGISAILLLVATIATVRFTDFSEASEISADTSGAAGTNATGALTWQPYSDRAVTEALSAGKPVFVDFTASWCVTCQINKKLVLDTERGQQIFASRGIGLFRADWTKRDKEISNALARLGRNSVPVYAFYGEGNKSGGGGGVKLLPEILTFEILEAALDGAK